MKTDDQQRPRKAIMALVTVIAVAGVTTASAQQTRYYSAPTARASERPALTARAPRRSATRAATSSVSKPKR
jgi:hypothetical protein